MRNENNIVDDSESTINASTSAVLYDISKRAGNRIVGIGEILVENHNERQHKRSAALDNSTPQSDDNSMTDINRQQVADMLAASEAKVDARLANFDTSVKTGFAELKVEIQKMRGDFEKQSHDSTKWIIGSVFAMISLAVALIGVMINLNKAEKPVAQPAAQPAPIVITVPGATPEAVAPAPKK